MIAWLLHLHGAWIGEAYPTKSPETNPQVGTENRPIKQLIKAGSLEKEKIEELVPDEGRWLVKTAGLLHSREFWLHNFPDAWWLCPARPLDDIVRSRSLHPGTKGRGERRNRAIAAQQIQDQRNVFIRARKAWAYSPGELCRGGTTGEGVARRIFEFVEMEMDPEIYHGWVEPERWHGAHD